MKKLFLSLFVSITALTALAQSNDCSSATTLTPGATCVNTSGTTAGATQSIPGCVGTADDDVWYQFVATNSTQQITVTPSSGFDPVVQLFSGTCSALSTISCMDNGLTGDAESIYATGLTVGQTYRVRVYHYYAGAPTTSTFSICVTNPPAAPSNNTCGGAIGLTVNTVCSATAGTSVGATQSYTGCAGTADDDVFFSFVATNAVQTITVNPSSTMDPVVELYSGTCATLTSIQCEDAGFTDDDEVISAVGLTVGATYYVRVYDYYSNTGGAPFTICVTGAATAAPSNDEPCNAIALPAVTSACNYLSFTTTSATTTATPGTPSATCVNWNNGTSSYGAPSSGGFGAGTKDVWFAITVPSTGNVTITTQPGLASPTNDMVFALYTGACGSLSQISCSDDYNYPGSANDLQPFINQTGLTPGSTIYLRVYCYGTTNSGTFGLCVSTNTNDACANALYICDLNGYSASTSAAFTPDRPGTGTGQMYGNNETAAGVNQPDGTNTGGPFGYYPYPGTTAGPYSSPAIDVNIDNNSWIRFTAANTTATLNVSVGNCFVGSYPSGGIQMQIFSASSCNNFVPVSSFRENSTAFTITANGLTVGQDYYLMVDGYAGDICNYTISANSGVQFPDIVASANPICAGASILLTAPSGATAYEWAPGGATTQTITVSPSTTTTYTCYVSGVCGQRQTLTKTITVNQLPNMTSSASPSAICSGSTLSIGLTSDIASTYSWLATDNTSVSGESTSAQTGNTINNTLTSSVGTVQTVTYTVTPTSTSGSCAGPSQTVTVTVNPKPTISSVSSQTVCAGNSSAAITFTTANPATSTVNWSNSNTSIGLGASASGVSSIPTFVTTSTLTTTQVATITATPVAPAGVGSCVGSSTTFSITVNPTPVITAPTVSAACGGTTVSVPNFTVSPSSTINWTNNNTGVGLGASGTGNIVSFTAANVTSATSATVTASTSLNGCPAVDKTFTITINPTPTFTLSASATQDVCGGATVNAISFSSTPVGSTINWVNNNTNNGIIASGSGNIASYTAPSVTTTQVGTITATPVSGSCTGSNQQFIITIKPTPVISVPSVSPVCGGGNVVVPTFTVSPSSMVSWSNNNTAIGLGTNGTGNISNFNAANVTSVTTGTITASTTLSGCPATNQTFTISINPTPTFTLSAGATQTICGGNPTNAINFSTTPIGSNINWTNTGSGIGLSSSGSGDIASYTAPLVTGSQSGVITATPSTGSCTGSTQQFTVTINPTPVISSVSNTTVCGNTLVPAVNFSVTPNTSIDWNNNNTSTGLAQTSGTGGVLSFTSANVTTVTSGTVTLTATLNGCNAASVPYTITVNPLPQLTATPSETQSGCGVSTGALTGVGVTGNGALNYNWTNSSNVTVGTSQDLTNVSAGSYNLIITDNNCTATLGPFQITNPGAPLQPTINSTSGTTLCVGDALDLVAGSTEINPTFTWTGPVAGASGTTLTIPAVTLADAGTYTVTITLPNSCTNTQTVSVIVNPVPSPSATSSADPYCSGQQIDLFGSGGTSYQWNGPNSYSSTAQNPSIINSTGSMTGTYTLTATNAAGCDATTTISVTVNQTPPVPTASATDAILCEGEDLQLNASSTGATSFSWTGPNGYASTITNPLLTNVTTAEGGAYIVNATIGNCTSADTTILVTVNVNPVATIGVLASPVCSGSSIDLNGSGGTSYTWFGPNSFSSSQQNPSITPATTQMSGTYTLTVSDGNNCSAVDSISVLVNATPNVPLITASGTALCEGDTLQLNATATNGITYTWLGPNSYSSSLQNPVINGVTVAQSGTYTVSATSNNCTGLADSISVTINVIPVADASTSVNVACSGDIVDLFGTGGGSYSWQGPSGFSSASSSPQLSPSTVAMSGTYTLTVSSNGCSSNDTVSVIINPTPGLPVIVANSNSICEGEDIVLNAVSSNAINYSWVGPNGFSSSSQNVSILGATVNNSGTYTVTAIANSCTGPSETVAVTVNPTPIAAATASASFICSGNTLDINGSGGSTYAWAGPNGYASSQQNNSLTNIDVLASGTYTYTAINPGNCTDTATVNVVVNQTPAAAITSSASTCNGSPLILTASGSGLISWYTDSTLTSLISNDDTLYPNLPVNSTADYYVTVSANGCTSVISQVTASNYNVNAALTASATSGYAPLPVVFTNNSLGVDVNDAFNWTINTTSFSTSYNSSYQFETGGTFNVVLSVTDIQSGCMDTALVTIVVEDEIRVVIPNIFTPNGDGINDGFAIDIKGGKEAKGMIYNRWGQLLYEWDAINVTWDGKLSNGESVSDGIYFYIIKIVGYNGDKLDVPGNVTIIR